MTTQASDVVTAEVLRAALDAFKHHNMTVTTHVGQCLRAALIASGLPAEVARLREENSHLRDEYAAEIGRTRAELSRLRDEVARLKSENVMIHSWMSRCELAEAELSWLLGELAAWKARFTAYEYRAQDDCVALKDQQP